ncbi:MAG: SpoIID/LytB domain-containing protein [Lachnospiraceae bacterium]|nr:SpoIID/LytB domain-containing protein [Lachnospiraceae bacterium]
MERRKLINFVAGMTTVILALLIVIVVMEPKDVGVSRAVASKVVALTLAPKEEVLENGPDNSYFPEVLQNEWYVKYMDYLYEIGYLDPERIAAEESSALSSVVYADLSEWIMASSMENEKDLSGYLVEPKEKKAQKPVAKAEFWRFYEAFLTAMDTEKNVKALDVDIYGTPDNVQTAAAWTAYTSDGKFTFEGLSLDAYIDRKIRILVRDQEILRVEEMLSEEIVYENAWISGYDDGKVTVFIGNVQKQFPVKGVLKDRDELSGQIGDLYLKKGKPSRLVLKKDTIKGTVLAVRENEIEIEGYGDVPLAENFKIYRTYGVLREQQKKDILVGYHMQTFVVAGGEICAALTTEKPEMDTIRVLLMSAGFESLFHSSVVLSCDVDAVLEYGDGKDLKTQPVTAGETITIKPDDQRLQSGRMIFRSIDEGGMIKVNHLERSQGQPVYPGHMEITKEDEGLLLLNEVGLEDYLKRVVPSEMPATYQLEALKAQAICARTYAWRQIQGNAYSQYGAHVDDSTNFQVYNNTNTFAFTDSAVNETFGQVLAYEGVPIEAFYYSTSCGHGTDGSVWGGESKATPYLNAVSVDDKGKTIDLYSNESFEAFIKRVDSNAYESEFAMYRWQVKTNSQILSKKIGEVGRITGLTVAERGPGGIARAIKVVGTDGSLMFTNQSKIRTILGNVEMIYTRNDGSEYSGWESLPSAFIYIENNGTDTENVTWFTIYGGGYGHGAGMSQNGAQGMAKSGKSCMEILRFFYQGCEVIDIGEVS